MSVNSVNLLSVTIVESDTASSVINFEKEQRLFAVRVPEDFVEANLAVQMSLDDGVTWDFVSRKGVHIVVTAIAGEICCVDNPVDLAVFPALRFLSVSKTDNTTPVIQTEEQEVRLLCRRF